MGLREINYKIIVSSFIIATIIFLGGFFLSYNISYYQFTQLAESQENLKTSLISLELQREILDCNTFSPYIFAGDLNNVEKNLAVLEEKLGKENLNVLKEKELYSLLEIQHFLLIRDYNSLCHQNITTILFFYSNELDNLDNAERSGIILSEFKSKNKDIMIYSFDMSLKDNLLNSLKSRYNISSPNTVVINEIEKVENLQNIDQLSKWNTK